MHDRQTVESLWTRLAAMEAERRFNGHAYPEGMKSFPFRLRGQGFFPGGDGLWRDDADLCASSSGLLPVGGIMFVGNDFGTLAQFQKLKTRSFENPPTWRHLKERIARAEVSKNCVFCTNAVMGLRSHGKALDKRRWEAMPGFGQFCREFFAYQVETMKPRLIVVLGARTETTIMQVEGVESTLDLPEVLIGNHQCDIYFTTHPYGDFNFSEAHKLQEAGALREAWRLASVS